jgi:hypothetical protein
MEFWIFDLIFFWQPVHGISGLEPVLVAAIPTLRFTREAFSSAEDAQ